MPTSCALNRNSISRTKLRDGMCCCTRLEDPAHNLLEPRRAWRGLQRFMIVAKDLRFGPEKSVFGAQTILRVAERQLEVRVEINDAKVFTGRLFGLLRFDMLHVSLSVENF